MTALVVLSLAMFGGEPTLGSATNADHTRFAAAAQVLAAHCLRCHNADTTRGGLDISTRESLFAGGATSDAVVPLQSEASPLLTRASAGSMPPEKDGRRLNAMELATLTAWIEQGAVWPNEQQILATPISTSRGAFSPAPRIVPAGRIILAELAPTSTPVASPRRWLFRHRQQR